VQVVIEASIVEARIRENLPGVTHVEIRDLTGTQDHYDATIVASAFEGLGRVAQHQLVYRALGELMAGPVHALALKTFTPEAWTTRGGRQ
jgi:stress-induced morphogen